MDRVGALLQKEYPDTNRTHGVYVRPLAEDLARPVRSGLLMLLAAVAFVLLIACVNVANLLLARAASRRREMAVRAALGAGRGRLAGQALTESVLLGLAGGAAGLVVAQWAIGLVRRLVPAGLPLLGVQHIGLDGRVLLFTFLISILTGLVFGLLPAWHIAREDVNAVAEGRRTIAGERAAPSAHRTGRRRDRPRLAAARRRRADPAQLPPAAEHRRGIRDRRPDHRPPGPAGPQVRRRWDAIGSARRSRTPVRGDSRGPRRGRNQPAAARQRELADGRRDRRPGADSRHADASAHPRRHPPLLRGHGHAARQRAPVRRGRSREVAAGGHRQSDDGRSLLARRVTARKTRAARRHAGMARGRRRGRRRAELGPRPSGQSRDVSAGSAAPLDDGLLRRRHGPAGASPRRGDARGAPRGRSGSARCRACGRWRKWRNARTRRGSRR